MQERLQWIVSTPEVWCDWAPVRGGIQTHNLVAQRYPKAQNYIVEGNAAHQQQARTLWQPSRWNSLLRRQAGVQFGTPPARSLDMLWSNMALHLAPDPQALLQEWSELIKPQGFLMFSCLGPDTVQELRQLYQDYGWPVPGHSFTDMHDLGDMLVQHGFAEPVMDMERIQLRYSSATRLLQELRELGRNFHPGRFTGLRTPRWQRQLEDALMAAAQPATDHAENEPDTGITLTFEIIYGHAFKAQTKALVQEQSTIALEDMKSMLRKGR